jgi:hypothetical protein
VSWSNATTRKPTASQTSFENGRRPYAQFLYSWSGGLGAELMLYRR